MNYEVNMADKRKKKRIFHINMLREWHTPVDVAYTTSEPVVEDLEDDIVLCYDDSEESNDSPKIGAELSPEQKTTLQQFLHDSSDVLQDKPGRTHQIEHRIDMKSSSPIRLPPYHLPHAYHDSVRTDLKEMEASGIIEPSTSEWAFPIVLVKRKEGWNNADVCRLPPSQ